MIQVGEPQGCSFSGGSQEAYRPIGAWRLRLGIFDAEPEKRVYKNKAKTCTMINI